MRRHHYNRRLARAPHIDYRAHREFALNLMFNSSDRICHEQLRMKMGPFHRLCTRLRRYWLADNQFVRVEEQVAMFLNTVGHDHRN